MTELVVITPAELANLIQLAVTSAMQAYTTATTGKSPKPQHRQLLNSKELATALKCSYQTIWNYTNTKKIPSLKINRIHLYDLDEVLLALDSAQVKL